MRRFYKLSSAIASGLLLLVAMLPMQAALAQSSGNKSGSGNGFRISPVRSELTVEKGQSQQLTVTVENPTAESTTAKAIINNFIASDNEDGEARLILDEKAPTPKNDFKKLVQPIPDVPLSAKEKKDIQVTISVPKDANSGGYYGAIRFVPTTGTAGNIGLTASVGTIVLVRVPGNLTEQLDLVQFSAADGSSAKSFFTKGNVSSLIRLKNSGDIHVKPYGTVLVKDMFGKIVTQYEFNNTEPRANILPDSTRKFVNELSHKSWLGRYTIEANIGYSSGGGQLITAKTSFWYIPIPVLIGLIAVLVLIVAAIFWIVRKTRAKRQHKHEVNKKNQND